MLLQISALDLLFARAGNDSEGTRVNVRIEFRVVFAGTTSFVRTRLRLVFAVVFVQEYVVERDPLVTLLVRARHRQSIHQMVDHVILDPRDTLSGLFAQRAQTIKQRADETDELVAARAFYWTAEDLIAHIATELVRYCVG